MADAAPRLRNGQRSNGLQATKRLQASPKDTIAQLHKLLNTPLGQQATLSDLLPVLKKTGSKTHQYKQDATLKQIVGPATLKSVDDGIAALGGTRRESKELLTVPAARSQQQAGGTSSILGPGTKRAAEELVLSLALETPQVSHFAATQQPPASDTAWLEEVLAAHASATEVPVPQGASSGALQHTSTDTETIQRRALVLHFPQAAAAHSGTWAAEVTDWKGNNCLLVLPAQKPSSRFDAQCLQALILDIAAEPALAANKAVEWRQERLQECCARSLACLAHNTLNWSLVLDPDSAFPVLQPSPCRRSRAALSSSGGADVDGQPAAGQPSPADSPQRPAGTASAVARAHATVGLGGHDLWCTGGFLAALTAAMADAVMQAEVHCTERGRAFASIWNLYTAATNTTVGALQGRLQSLEETQTTQNAQLLQLQTGLATSTRLCALLQRDAARRDRAAEKAAREMAGAAPVQVQLKVREWQINRSAEHARRRMAALRWQYAGAAVITLGFVPRKPVHHKVEDDDDHLVKSLTEVEALTRSAAALWARRRLGQTAGGGIGTSVSLKPQSLGKAMAANPQAAVQMLEALTPEAQALALMSMGMGDCVQLLNGLPEDQLAAILASLTDASRTELLAALRTVNEHLAECAYDTMRYTPHLASKFLPSIPPQQGREELKAQDAALRRHVLLGMQARDAAILLEGFREDLRAAYVAELPDDATGLIIGCMTRGLAIEVLRDLGNPRALQALLGMAPADALRLLQHIDLADAVILARGLSPAEVEQLAQFLSPATADKLRARLAAPEEVPEMLRQSTLEADLLAQLAALRPVEPEVDERAEAIRAAALKAVQKGKGKKSAKKPIIVLPKSPQDGSPRVDATPISPTTPTDLASWAAVLGALPSPETAASLKQLPAEVVQRAASALAALAGFPTSASAAPAAASEVSVAPPPAEDAAAPNIEQPVAAPPEDELTSAAELSFALGSESRGASLLTPPADPVDAGGKAEGEWPGFRRSAEQQLGSSRQASSRRSSRGGEQAASSRRASRVSRESGVLTDADLAAAQASTLPVGPARDQRLESVKSTHPGAKIRTLGWVLAVIEGVYSDFEAQALRLGGLGAVALNGSEGPGRLTIPDVTFSFLLNKYGSRALVDEYVGSLINTLGAWQLTEARLSIFSRLLTEEWPAAVAATYLQARVFLGRPAFQVACIEYPPEAGKPPAWVDLAKAAAAADAALGIRSEAARAAFVEHLRSMGMQAAAEDLPYLNQASRAEPPRAADFWKLSRDAFLMALCEESARIESALAAATPLLFMHIAAKAPIGIPGLDSDEEDVELEGPGRVLAVPSVSLQEWAQVELLPESSSMTPTELAELTAMFESRAAAGQAGGVTLEGFTRVAERSKVIRDYLLLRHVPAYNYRADATSSLEELTTQDKLVLRHLEAMLPTWRQLIAGAPDAWHARLTALVERVGSQQLGVRQLQLYATLLQALAALGIQGLMSQTPTILQPEEATGLDENTTADQQLARVEQAIVVLHGGGPVRQELQIVQNVNELPQI